MKSTWSKRSEEELIRLANEDVSNREIAKRLGRSVPSVQTKLNRLRNPATKRRGKKPTTPSQELRDWFAGMALVGLCSNPNLLDLGKSVRLADCAYDIAQSMIEERTKRNEVQG